MTKDSKVKKAAKDLSITMPLLVRNMFSIGKNPGPHHIPRSMWEVLVCIHQFKCATVTEMSAKLHKPKSNLTPLIDKLVKEEYALRIYDHNDRRVVRIELTPKGEETVRKITMHFQANMADMLSYLEEDEVAEFHDAVKIIMKLTQKISEAAHIE